MILGLSKFILRCCIRRLCFFVFLQIKLTCALKFTWILSAAWKSFCPIPACTYASLFLPPSVHLCTNATVVYLSGTGYPPHIFSLSLSIPLFHIAFYVSLSQEWPLCIVSDQVARECLQKWPTKWATESKGLWMINTYTEQEPQCWLNLSMLWWVKSLYFCKGSDDGSRLFTMSWLFNKWHFKLWN